MNLLLLPALAGLVLAAPVQAPSSDPTLAPSTVVAPDGRSVTDGVRTLSATQAADLDPNGQTITVSGAGYDEAKGIYVAFCVIPAANLAPSPCGGGAATTGGTGASQWISSDPPSYGVGLAVPYGPDGTFGATLTVSPTVAPGIDCRAVACAVVTRNDHTRGSDRSQDLFIPVTFAGSAPPPTTPTTVPAAPSSTPPPNPSSTVATSPDENIGRQTTGHLTVDRTTGLDPDGTAVTVEGEGYDITKGIYVAFCALPEAGQVPGPCSTGSVGTSAWISSNPPDYGRDLAQPYDDGGSFSTTIEVTAVIDAETDCREVPCGIVTRNDDTNHDDRSQDVFVPVSFAGDDVAASSSGDVPWVWIGGAVVVAVAASTPISLKWRERATS